MAPHDNGILGGPSTSAAAPWETALRWSLPKGGVAICGISEKFAANPVGGSDLLSVRIATSLGRSAFDPQVARAFDSDAGTGLFGFGWNLVLPSITRKSDKRLPQDRDAEGADAFIHSDAENLDPVLDPVGRRLTVLLGRPTVLDFRSMGNNNDKAFVSTPVPAWGILAASGRSSSGGGLRWAR